MTVYHLCDVCRIRMSDYIVEIKDTKEDIMNALVNVNGVESLDNIKLTPEQQAKTESLVEEITNRPREEKTKNK